MSSFAPNSGGISRRLVPLAGGCRPEKTTLANTFGWGGSPAKPNVERESLEDPFPRTFLQLPHALLGAPLHLRACWRSIITRTLIDITARAHCICRAASNSRHLKLFEAGLKRNPSPRWRSSPSRTLRVCLVPMVARSATGDHKCRWVEAFSICPANGLVL